MASESASDSPITEAITAQNELRNETKTADDTTTTTTKDAEQKADKLAGSASPLLGDKRGLDEGESTPSASNIGLKKQKTEDDTAEQLETTAKATSTTDNAGPSTNGQKKKAGRPKKGTNTNPVKKISPRPTDGIGSRTRSRAKPSN